MAVSTEPNAPMPRPPRHSDIREFGRSARAGAAVHTDIAADVLRLGVPLFLRLAGTALQARTRVHVGTTDFLWLGRFGRGGGRRRCFGRRFGGGCREREGK